MEREEILKKAIEKAVGNGFKSDEFCVESILSLGSAYANDVVCETLLFDHEFAKAFWGEEEEWYCPKCGGIDLYKDGLNQTRCNWCDINISPKKTEIWKENLKELAISTDRLKYISKFI
jgi:hypothetical protein